MTVVAVVLWRLGAASFWLWRDEQVEMRKQAASLKEEIGRHERLEREDANAYTTNLRTELRDAFAKSLATVAIDCYMHDRNLPIGSTIITHNMEKTLPHVDLINSLSLRRD